MRLNRGYLDRCELLDERGPRSPSVYDKGREAVFTSSNHHTNVGDKSVVPSVWNGSNVVVGTALNSGAPFGVADESLHDELVIVVIKIHEGLKFH
jgi:hypothetical protein